jgi:hypothetical protein
MNEIEETPEYLAALRLLESGEITMAEAGRLRRLTRQRIYAIVRRVDKLASIRKARIARVNSLWRKTLDAIEG